ncbi:MAG: hypothetical protein IH944_13080 [Armatimonadetes bacterium]|nr:hypothetical protein [Armatimonadota bacterium]
MNLRTRKIASMVGLFVAASSSSAQVNLFTSFEPPTIPLGSTDFTIGTPPDTAHFTGGIATSIGNFNAYRSGIAAWGVTTPNQVGTCDFDNPASIVSFWAVNLGGSAGFVQVFDNSDVLIATIPIIGTNMMVDPPMTFTAAQFGATGIGKFTITNGPGRFDQVWIDNLSATVQAETTLVLPDSFSLFRGILTGGGLSDLLASDDSWMTVLPGITLNQAERQVQLIVVGTSPTETPSELRFRVEAHAEINNIGQWIELWNYDNNSYEQVDFMIATMVDSIVEVIITVDPERFIQAGTKEMKSKVSYKEAGIVLSFPWLISFDQTVWTIVN